MAVNNPYAAYQKNKIQTASPAELTLILYDAAIKFCNVALRAIEEDDVESRHTNIVKAEKIIEEFLATLNYKYEVAKDFEQVYNYIYHLLVEANIHNDAEKLEEALQHLRDMREIWKEIMKQARQMEASHKE